MSAGGEQPDLGRGYEHFELPYTPDHRLPRKQPKGKRHLPISKSPAKRGELLENLLQAYEQALNFKGIYTDDRIYFRIRFTGDVGLRPIDKAISSLGGEVVSLLDDKTIKLAIRRKDYGRLKLNVHRNRNIIAGVSQTTLSDIATEEFAAKLKEAPARRLSVTMRLFDAGGLKDKEMIESSIREFLGHRGSVSEIYAAENWALLAVDAPSSDIQDIISSVKIVEHVAELPQITLVPIEGKRSRDDVRLASMVDLGTSKATVNLPIVCVIDSGVNRQHRLLKEYIAGTWDFKTGEEGPCKDVDEHGSLVAGIAIYGGNLETHARPVSRAIVVKAFENDKRLDQVIPMISRAVDRFGTVSKVFNLSFGAKGPNLDLSQALNELVYRKGIVVIAAAGNISKEEVKYHLNQGESYPDYIFKHLILFPGDVDNAITVGSYSAKPSNRFQALTPSPFTASGEDGKFVKPDLLAEGGNLTVVEERNSVVNVNYTGVGIRSTGSNGDETPERAGTSFASPAIASLATRVLEKYPNASPYLVKALILSSTKRLEGKLAPDKFISPYSALIQGYGQPDEYLTLSSNDWRVSYILQGEFSGSDPLEIHNYEFKVADDAEKVKITFVAGRPAWSDGYFRIRVIKSGPKERTVSKIDASETIGDVNTRKRITTTYREVYPKKHGGVGVWKLRVIPHFTRKSGIEKSLKYGCVVTVESSYANNIYKDISKWLEERKKIALAEKILQQQETPVPVQKEEEQMTLARV